jgi:hypothetical protein
MNRYALLAYAGKKLGYKENELCPIFKVNRRTLNRWCNEVYEELKHKDMSHFSYSEGCEVPLFFFGGTNELENIERRNVCKGRKART